MKHKRKENLTKIKSNVFLWIKKHIKMIIYFAIFILAIIFIVISFLLKDNWINICSGVGTGLLTSLIVSVIINAENNAREKRKKEEEKKFILEPLLRYSVDVYEILIYNINKFMTITEQKETNIYELYNDFSTYSSFENKLKEIDLTKIDFKGKESFYKFITSTHYKIDFFIAELKRLPKNEYYLKGLLTKDEHNNLTNNYISDNYLSKANKIQVFGKYNEDSKSDYIQFLKMTTFICSNIVSCFSNSKEEAKKRETDVKKKIRVIDYEENYLYSDAYFEEQEEEAQYYYDYPEEFERLEKEYQDSLNETDEDRTLKELYYYILGLIDVNIDELLSQINPNNPNVINFLQQKETKKILNKKRKMKKAIIKKFGKDCLTNSKK